MKHSRTCFGLGIILTLVVVGMWSAPDLAARVTYAVQTGQADAAAARLATAADLSEAFAGVAEVIQPSVVSIVSAHRIAAFDRGPRLPAPLREFFGDRLPEDFSPPGGHGGDLVERGLGTGVIVSKDGYIVTNRHVILDADEVTVKLSDDRTLTAKTVGQDPKTDVAVLKVVADDLHPASLGDSDGLRIGEWVVAVGNPFGLSSTITAGIVSATGRANVGIADYEDFIQTDAAINPGNSGGPLVNLRGDVVGINTAIFSKSGGYTGIGFAIPINMVKSIQESLIATGQVDRGWLGVAIQDLDQGLARSFGFEGRDGVLVSQVEPDSPAAKAGLQAGDIITRYNGKQVSRMHKLRATVAATRPGDRTDIEVFRDGAVRNLTVELGQLQAELAAVRTQSESPELGLTVQTLTPDIALQLNLEEDLVGVVVTEVKPLSPAERAGIQVKDVILSVQNAGVNNVGQFRKAMQEHDLSKGVRLVVQTGPVKRFVFLQANE